jgi:hypothetical protein
MEATLHQLYEEGGNYNRINLNRTSYRMVFGADVSRPSP